MFVHSGEKGSPGEVRIFPGDSGQKGEKGLSGNPGPEGEACVCRGGVLSRRGAAYREANQLQPAAASSVLKL